jgi:hypothetical protein
MVPRILLVQIALAALLRAAPAVTKVEPPN